MSARVSSVPSGGWRVASLRGGRPTFHASHPGEVIQPAGPGDADDDADADRHRNGVAVDGDGSSDGLVDLRRDRNGIGGAMDGRRCGQDLVAANSGDNVAAQLTGNWRASACRPTPSLWAWRLPSLRGLLRRLEELLDEQRGAEGTPGRRTQPVERAGARIRSSAATWPAGSRRRTADQAGRLEAEGGYRVVITDIWRVLRDVCTDPKSLPLSPGSFGGSPESEAPRSMRLTGQHLHVHRAGRAEPPARPDPRGRCGPESSALQ